MRKQCILVTTLHCYLFLQYSHIYHHITLLYVPTLFEHITTLHWYLCLHCSSISPRYISPRYISPRYISPRYISPRYISPRYIAICFYKIYIVTIHLIRICGHKMESVVTVKFEPVTTDYNLWPVIWVSTANVFLPIPIYDHIFISTHYKWLVIPSKHVYHIYTTMIPVNTRHVYNNDTTWPWTNIRPTMTERPVLAGLTAWRHCRPVVWRRWMATW